MPDSNWLERELTRQLAPVTAPESLWKTIANRQRMPHRHLTRGWVLWPLAATMALVAFAGVLHLRPVTGSDTFRDQELTFLRDSAASRGYDFRAASFEETRAWVKAEANIDIDLPAADPAADSGAAHVLGARLTTCGGVRVAAIDYRAGDQSATLFVSARQAGLTGNTEGSKHLFSQTEADGDERIVSWNMGSQTYSIAWTGAKSSHGACLLCHASIPG